MREIQAGVLFGIACGLIFSAPHPLSGQGPAKSRLPARSSAKGSPTEDIRSTTVDMELLTLDGNGLAAQQWRSALEAVDISLTIRRATEDEEPETIEKMSGKLRRVKVVGLMDRTGKIIFADRVFEQGDREKIKAWVQELQAYGAQGSPAGKPLWGLNEDQFNEIYNGLTESTTTDFRDQKLADAVSALPLPARFPLRWSDVAQKRLNEARRDVVVRQNTQGFTVATALAIMLRDAELGFHPHRLPSGEIELLIDIPGKSTEVWPVGWPLQTQRQQAAPKMFTLNQVLLEDGPLIEILAKAAQDSETSILFDYQELDRLTHDWASTTISYRPRQATWYTVLREVLNKGKLSSDLWQDEAGRPFLYVTSLKSKRGPMAKPRPQ